MDSLPEPACGQFALGFTIPCMRLRCALLAACVASCGPPRQQAAFFSFEGSLQNWEPHGLDLQAGGAEENWSITTNPAVAYDGPSSVRFFLDNVNGRGKIWLEKTFTLSPRGRYTAHIDFAVRAAKDAAPADPLIAGILPAPPRTDDALQPALGLPGISGTSWATRVYDLQLEGDSATVVIGISGTSPGQIVDYLDAVTVLFTER
jgi:hypothetical protein